MSVLDALQAVVALAGLVALVHWVLMRRAVHDVTAQLRRRRVEGTRVPVHLDLVDRSMQDLAIEVNATIASSQAAVMARRRQEERYRELMAELSHDLRTPLTAVRGYQQMLLASDLSASQRDQLRTAARHADALALLIDEVFEYAWLADAASGGGPGGAQGAGAGPGAMGWAAGAVPGAAERERVDLVEELGQALAGTAGALERAGLEVEVDVPDALLVEVDAAALRRLLANLVRNAAQHGRGRLAVELEAAGGPTGAGGRDAVGDQAVGTGTVVLRMRNGVRHPQALDITRVLERRWSSDPAGTGLGLSIVALLVAQMGGSLSVDAVDGDFEVVVTLSGLLRPGGRR